MLSFSLVCILKVSVVKSLRSKSLLFKLWKQGSYFPVRPKRGRGAPSKPKILASPEKRFTTCIVMTGPTRAHIPVCHLWHVIARANMPPLPVSGH
jgi:hypothetical protein